MSNKHNKAHAVPQGCEVIRKKLARFMECAEDNEGTDIGRDWLDALTTIGALARVQRSPALWEITDAGRAILAATPAAPSQEPVNRPQNCGTGHCSCIECVCKPSQEPAVNLSCKSTQARLAAQWGYVPAPSQEPVTLTELLRQGFAVLMAKAYSEEWFDGLSSIDGLYEFLVAEGERIPDDTTIGGTIEAIIAALREKEARK